MPWVAEPDDFGEPGGTWGVYYEVRDCDGMSGFAGLAVDCITEEFARIIAQRLND